MKHLLFVSLLVMLTACGSSSSSVTIPRPVHTLAPNQSVGGLWAGSVDGSTGEPAPIKVLVAENGQFFSYAVSASQDCADLSTGKITSNGDALTGNVQTSVVNLSTSSCQYSDKTTFSTSTIVGSVEQRAQLNATLTTTTSIGHVLPGQNVSLNYNNLYSQASNLSKVNANWTTPAGDTVSITASGALTVQELSTGCMINGQVSIINAQYNAYAVTLTYANCNSSYAILNNAEATGLAFIDDTKNPVDLIIGYNITTMLASCLQANVGNCGNGTVILVYSLVKQ